MTGLPIAEDHPGFDAERLARATAILRGGVEEGVYPGAVAGIAHKGRIVYLEAVGRQQDGPERRPTMPADAIFDLASVSKPVAGTALMLCIEDGLLTLDDQVGRYIPEFAGGAKAEIRIRQLVSHTSGIQSNPKLYHEHESWETLRQAYLELPLAGRPGSLFLYSSINFIILALIIEKVTGRSLDALLDERVFGPLGMRDTRYNPPAEWRSRIPATEFVTWRGSYDWGVVNDKTAQMMGGVSGHAGIFASAADLLLYGTMLLEGGRYGDARIMSPAAARLFTSTWTGANGTPLGLCWRAGLAGTFGDLLAGRCVGHTGTTGTAMCLMPAERTAIVLLTNRVHPTRDNALIEGFRPRFFNAVAAAFDGNGET